MNKINKQKQIKKCTIDKVNKALVCGVYYGHKNSQGVFTVFKDGKLHWITTEAWKLKIYLICCRIKGIKVFEEVN